MNYEKKINKISKLITIRGDFAPLTGEVTKADGVVSFNNGIFEITSRFEHHPTGVIKRCDTVKNVSDRDISISSVLSKFVLNGGDYEVYTQYSEWCGESKGRWQPLVTEVCAQNDDIRANAGAAPFVAVYNLQNGRGIAFHILCDGVWRYRVRKHFSQTGQHKTVTVELGLDDKSFDYILSAGASLELPSIVYYEFRNKTDMDAYKLHRYCNEISPARSLPVVYNSWMSRFDTINIDILSEQLAIAKDIGAEYFVIDAGWFGKAGEWFASVGDWKECEEYSMSGRMKEFADKVRASGLGFGLWFEAERAAKSAIAVSEHPELYLEENGNCFINFADPKACDYIYSVIAESIRKYGIEYIKFDFNAELSYDPERLSFINYFKGYRDFIARLRSEFPSLYLECCASGGMRIALSNVGLFDSFWLSDDHSLYNQLDIFKGTLLRMPSRALEKWVTVRSLEDFGVTASNERILVSGDCGWGHIESVSADYMRAVAFGGPIGISCDLTRLSPQLKDSLTELVNSFKQDREFWKNSECHILVDSAQLTVLQYNDRKMEQVKLFSYTKLPQQNAVTVYPVCDMSAEYTDGNGSVYSAQALEDEGLELKIGGRFTAKAVTLIKNK